jgi:hypothetical protein
MRQNKTRSHTPHPDSRKKSTGVADVKSSSASLAMGIAISFIHDASRCKKAPGLRHVI